MCLIMGLVDKLKSLLQMLSIPSIYDLRGKTWKMEESIGNEGIYICIDIYAHLHSFHPLFFSWSQLHTFFPLLLFLCFSYMYTSNMHILKRVCILEVSKCRWNRGGALKLPLGSGGKEEILMHLRLKGMLIRRKEEDKDRRGKSQSAMQIDSH